MATARRISVEIAAQVRTGTEARQSPTKHFVAMKLPKRSTLARNSLPIA